MDKVEKNPNLPDGITQRGLETYRKIAENQIKRRGDKNGIQEKRIEFIDKFLKK